MALNIACSGHEHLHFMDLSVSFTKIGWKFFYMVIVFAQRGLKIFFYLQRRAFPWSKLLFPLEVLGTVRYPWFYGQADSSSTDSSRVMSWAAVCGELGQRGSTAAR